MGHKKKKDAHHRKKSILPDNKPGTNSTHGSTSSSKRKEIGVVLKCDSAGTLEAIAASIPSAAPEGVDFTIIHSGIGAVNQSDIFMAETGSRLILGFDVDVAPKVEILSHEHTIEIRLYDVIYRLVDDLKKIGESLLPQENIEEIIGIAKVIALFKSSRKGIILGCEVLKGKLTVGKHFRIISAMGPVYSGIIESLQIEKNVIDTATVGQKVGLKIRNFKKVDIGNLVESYRSKTKERMKSWSPRAGVISF